MWSLFRSLTLFALYPCLLSGSEIFPKTHWGATAADVKGKYPSGIVEVKPTGETNIQVKTPLLGSLTARTTFSTRPVFGLNVIVAEFPAPGSTINPWTVRYLRPTAKQAEGIKASLTKALTGIYGKPSHVKATDYGSISVWKGKKDFARLKTVAIDSGRTDVRLWLETNNEHVFPTSVQNQLETVFTHTDEATWSKGGGMKVKWGMGPADVAEIYPDLKAIIVESYEPKKTFSTNAFIEGSVGINFYFYRGRLCEVRVGPFLRSGDPTHTSKKERQAYWDECQRWAERSREVLREKYGVPIEAPTPERIAEVEASGAGIHRLEWLWKTPETGIAFIRTTTAVQIILYQDLSPSGREAYEAEQAHDAAEEAARKAPF